MTRAQKSRQTPLDNLLVAARAFSAEFPHLLANHLPMILVALDRLGASEPRLHGYFAMYRDTKALVPVSPIVAPIRSCDWTEALGARGREADYRNFFEGEIRRLGIGDALAAYMPMLLPGIGASALHGFMRLAYGLMRTDPAEVGTALGYWAATFLDMPKPTGGAPITDDPGEVLALTCRLEGMHRLDPETDLLWHSIRAAGAASDFAPVIDWLAIGADTERRMTASALALYAATMDFSALHALTGMHWVRLTIPHLPAPHRPMLLRYFWQIIASLVPKIGFPAFPSDEEVETWRRCAAPEWRDIAETAVASDDEHDISLVFSAREEEKFYGDPLYRVVAAKRVGLIG